MRTIESTFNTLGASVLLLGYKGDSNATKILIDCADALEEYEGTTAALSITAPDGTVYPGDISLADGVVTWTVAARDTKVAGHGSARLDLVNDDDTVVASAEATTMIIKTNMNGIAPDQITDWTEAASVALQEVRAALLDIYQGDNTINASEAARQLAETGRVNAEQMRVQAENGRVTAEGLRDQAETARETAEGLRGQAETARETAEGLRDQAETDRQTAEEEREDGYATIEQNAQAALSYIAPSESTTTASAAHAAGDHLIYNGVYYEVIADIAVGDTLATSGTGANIKAVPDGVSGEVEELKSALNESKNLFTQFTTFARGSQSSGNINNYSNRVRSDIMTFNYPIYVTPNDGFRVNYSYFEDGAYINGTALKATTQYIPAGLSFRISIARVTEISDEQADIEYFSRQATFDTCLRYDIDTNAELIILE